MTSAASIYGFILPIFKNFTHPVLERARNTGNIFVRNRLSRYGAPGQHDGSVIENQRDKASESMLDKTSYRMKHNDSTLIDQVSYSHHDMMDVPRCKGKIETSIY